MLPAISPTGRDARAARTSLDAMKAIARVREEATEQRTSSSRLEDPVRCGDRGKVDTDGNN